MKRKRVENSPQKSQFGGRLLNWRKRNNPDSTFPWRNSRDPYEILVSEVLLVKTTRGQVQRMWHSFVDKFPDVDSLASADEEGLKAVIKPLGLEHKRARGLKEMARQLVSKRGGSVPDDKEELLGLKGVGRYVANAVLCFAFDQDAALVDTNILRIIHRCFSAGSDSARPRNDMDLWGLVGRLMPVGKGREFNLAILDFANLVCTSKLPKCSSCPMGDICDYNMRRGLWRKSRDAKISTG